MIWRLSGKKLLNFPKNILNSVEWVGREGEGDSNQPRGGGGE